MGSHTLMLASLLQLAVAPERAIAEHQVGRLLASALVAHSPPAGVNPHAGVRAWPTTLKEGATAASPPWMIRSSARSPARAAAPPISRAPRTSSPPRRRARRAARVARL